MPNEIIFYKTPNREQRNEVVYRDVNFWMTQKALAELFGVQRPAVTNDLGNIFATGELVEDSVSSILEHTADGSEKGDGASMQVFSSAVDDDEAAQVQPSAATSNRGGSRQVSNKVMN